MFIKNDQKCISPSQAAIRRFKPLFDRIVVEKFLPEIVCIIYQSLCYY